MMDENTFYIKLYRKTQTFSVNRPLYTIANGISPCASKFIRVALYAFVLPQTATVPGVNLVLMYLKCLMYLVLAEPRYLIMIVIVDFNDNFSYLLQRDFLYILFRVDFLLGVTSPVAF